MLAIAKVLMRTPKLLLLDEPSIGLAPRMIQQVAEADQEVWRTISRSSSPSRTSNMCCRWLMRRTFEQGRIVKTFSSADGGIDKTTILHEYLGGGSLKTPVNGTGPRT